MSVVTVAPPEFKDSIVGGTRIISLWINGHQVAGAVEHERNEYLRKSWESPTCWHITSGFGELDGVSIYDRRPLEARDEESAMQWLRFLAALYLANASA